MAGGGNIKVVVRCRPLNAREKARGAKPLVRMEGSRTILESPYMSTPSRALEKKAQAYSFDKSYWSAGPSNEPGHASQETLYEDLGVELLDHSFDGFNTCIFAYGQTGSGKSYSMMGYGKDRGIIPLTTAELFRRVESRQSDGLTYTVEVSYMEIYNERVRDLLNPKNKGNLRVREHPSLGPYVEDLSKLVVENYGQMMTLMDEGNKARTVASTTMNETSSRSHAVFTVILTQKRHDPTTNMTGEKVSRISLVDLAGSERQAATGATGARLKEGANINKSLTTLGKVIAALAQQSDARKRKEHVPYRDSVLTWLLKESLGGNSKTAMIATISPADYEETLSTLRYADAAKRIKTHAVVNEDPTAKLIRELKEELELLRNRVASGAPEEELPPDKQIVTYRTADGELRTVSKSELQDQLHASEKLMEEVNLTWEEKLAATQAIQVAREKALEELGITVEKDMVGVHAPQKYPSLVNLNEDPLMSECLVYQLRPGVTKVGSLDSSTAQIRLSGLHIAEEHCRFINEGGEVSIESEYGARTFVSGVLDETDGKVNGKRVAPSTSVRLQHGYRVILGDLHVFRFNDPAGVRAHRSRLSEVGSTMRSSFSDERPSTPTRPDSSARGELMDWTAARREVAEIELLADEDLDRLFDDIVKVRTLRGRPESRLGMRSDTPVEEILVDDIHESSDVSDGEGTPLHTPARPPRTESRLSRSGSIFRSLPTSPSKQIEDPVFERQAVKHLRLLSQEMKRIRSEAAHGQARGSLLPDLEWSARDLVLARNALAQWKRLQNFHIAEKLLLYAADVKEANIISKQLDQNVSYNFAILDGPLVSPKSVLDGLGGVVEYEDVSDAPATTGPRVVVKVLDHGSPQHTQPQPVVYMWSSSRFLQQLAHMRQVRDTNPKSTAVEHLNVELPFRDQPSPSLSYIGAARVSLRLLAYQASYTAAVPIFCPYTLEKIGSCRVDFACPSTPDTFTPKSAIAPVMQSKPFATKFTFTLTIDSVKGLADTDFTELHVQTRLSSLVGPVAAEDIFASAPINTDSKSLSNLLFRRSVSVFSTSAMEAHLSSGYASIEFFARARPGYIERLEAFDLSKEDSITREEPALAEPAPTPPRPSRPTLTRRNTEFLTGNHHDIHASIEVHELDGEGDYAPADVEDGVIHLHQGVQKQLCIALSHASGEALPWTKVASATADHIRVVSKDETTRVSSNEVDMHFVSQVTHSSDGTSQLVARGTWDTAAHHCTQLDRRTPNAEHLVVRLRLVLDIETVDEPAILTLDLKVRIIGRDARRSSMTFWRARPLTNVTAMFGMDLTPPLARTARDLWRLDTAKKPIRGEVVIGGWRPRSIALVREYATMARVRRLAADVQTTRAVLKAAGDVPLRQSDEDEQEDVLRRVVELWQGEMDTRVIFDVDQDTAEDKESADRLRRLIPEIATRLVPSVKQVVLNDTVIKQGKLAVLKDTRENVWEELHAILRPPYILLYPDLARRETQIINVANAIAEPSPDVEMLLGRRFCFKLYTITNSYIIQAASQKELTEWITVIGRQR